MATTNFTEQEETTLKERSLAGDKPTRNITSAIRSEKGWERESTQTSGNVLFRKSEWTRPENRGGVMSVERIFRSIGGFRKSEIRFMFWIACPDAPLTRLSMLVWTSHWLPLESDAHPIAHRFEWTVERRSGIDLRHDLDERVSSAKALKRSSISDSLILD